MKSRRYLLFCIVMILCFSLIIKEFFVLSTSEKVHGIDLKEFSQEIKTYEEVYGAKRGNIYDSNGNVLAQTHYTYRIIAFLDPSRSENSSVVSHVVDKEHTATVIAEVTGESYENVLKNLQRDSYQTYLGANTHSISITEKNLIESYNLPGVEFEERQARNYPFGEFASYIIGYAKYYDDDDEGVLVGELGIESSLNSQLKGEDGLYTYVGDSNGYRISGTPEEMVYAKNGDDVYLTIDKQIQLYVEKAVSEADEEYEPESIGVIVVEAQTGKILASTSRPTFNPNIRDVESYTNPLHEELIEPGSTMKIFTFLTAIDLGVYDGEEIYESGQYTLLDQTINDWNVYGWGNIDFDTGFYKSSNVASSILANEKIETTELFNYLDKYGFGNITEFGLPYEQAGIVEYKNPIDTVTASYGQGIAITPIQMVQALTVIANDGNMLQPYIIDRVVSADGKVVLQNEPEIKSSNVVSPQSVDQIKELMAGAINDENSVAKSYRVSGIDMIGKTGTAQISGDNGKYITGANNYLYSFVGMFPADEPEIIIYTWVKKPSYGASLAAASIYKSIASNVNAYYQFEDSTNIEVESSSSYLSDFTNVNIEDIELKVKNNGDYNYKIIGNGSSVISQYPNPDSIIRSYSTLYLVTDLTTIPDFTGMSYIDAKAICSILGISVEFEGRGYVRSQSIEKGTEITSDMTLNLKLE